MAFTIKGFQFSIQVTLSWFELVNKAQWQTVSSWNVCVQTCY
jgi:hypothetical protein